MRKSSATNNTHVPTLWVATQSRTSTAEANALLHEAKLTNAQGYSRLHVGPRAGAAVRMILNRKSNPLIPIRRLVIGGFRLPQQHHAAVTTRFPAVKVRLNLKPLDASKR